MPRRNSSRPKKRRTREHVIADLGVNHVERHILLAGFTVERVRHDYGIDLILFTYDGNGEIEWGEVFLQIKATDHVHMVSRGRSIAVRIQLAHLRYWLKESTPIILIVFDAQADAAYWVYVQALYQRRPELVWERTAGHVVLHVPTKQVLDREATVS